MSRLAPNRGRRRPAVNDYLTDGHLLVQVIGYRGADVVVEDVFTPADQDAPRLELQPEDLDRWRPVIPARKSREPAPAVA